MGEQQEVILTQEGFDKLEEELNYLKTEKRTEIAERIKVARGFGDLSENSEYDEAKNAQAENEQQIAELEAKIRHAKVIDSKEIDTKTVQIGNTVKLYDEEFEEEIEYTIVGSTEVDLTENKISNESPIGKALLGAKKGSTHRLVLYTLDAGGLLILRSNIHYTLSIFRIFSSALLFMVLTVLWFMSMIFETSSPS